MADTVFLKYSIYLTDEALVRSLKWPGGVVGDASRIAAMSPEAAAIRYSAPIVTTGPFVAPSIMSPFINTGDHFPTNVYTFDRKSGGWFGIPFLFPKTTHYYWRGEYVYSAPEVPFGATPPTMQRRRWIDGFELDRGDGPPNTAQEPIDPANNRGASRHPEGYGLVLESAAGVVRQHAVNEYIPGFTTNASWDRFYIRPRRFGATNPLHLWRTDTTASANDGYLLSLTPAGQLALYVLDTSGVYTLMGSTASDIALNVWSRIDILHTYGVTAGVRLYVNGSAVLTVSGGVSTAGRLHNHSQIGVQIAPTSQDGNCQVDDWMCADHPGLLTSLDGQNGSKIVRLRATGLAASNTVAGVDWRILLNNQNLDAALQSVTTAVSGDRLVVTTDSDVVIDRQPGSLGVVAMLVDAQTSVSAPGDGSLGWRFNGLETIAAVIPAETVVATGIDRRVLYRPVLGVSDPPAITPVDLVYVKAANAATATIRRLSAEVELIGVFGKEDLDPTIVDAEAPSASRGAHNAPYPESIWAHQGVPPQQPVVVVGGTYVGTGAGIDIAFRAPVHWLMIRNNTSNAWAMWSSQWATAHQNFQGRPVAGLIGRAEKDHSFVPAAGEDAQQERYVVHIPGNRTEVNAVGVTYSYIAFCDPGERFLINETLWDYESQTTILRDTLLIDATYTPDAAWVMYERPGTSAVDALYYKGPGTGATTMRLVSGGADTAATIAFGAGKVTLQNGTAFLVSSSGGGVHVSLFRKDDGSGDAGVPRAVQIFSYTGDGNASRTIAFGPTGRRPLAAWVIPHNGSNGVFRDFNHTGTNSESMNSSFSIITTGITGGGIDQIAVGSTLNVNAVVFDVFLFVGDSTAGNGGFSPPGEYIPVDPNPPPGGGWDAPPSEPPAEDVPPVETPGGPVVPPDTDFGTACAVATTKVCNIALSYVGISLQLVNISTDVGIEAEECRLHYVEALEETLRRYPWPFATGYATLVLTTGSEAVPVNRDWTYQYAAPSDMLYARRLAADTGVQRSWDRAPQRFRTIGTSIYADDADAVLEYTKRPTCAASQGDALFRDALAYQLAGRIAPALSRDDKRAGYCFAKFEDLFSRGIVAAANEDQKDDQPGDADWITERS